MNVAAPTQIGPLLPPPQATLEESYKKELRRVFGIEFNNLFTITNMPIKRFADQLHREGYLEVRILFFLFFFSLSCHFTKDTSGYTPLLRLLLRPPAILSCYRNI